MQDWPPVLPVFGQITPYPATPLYDRLRESGRLTRPEHWLDFTPFHMAHTPLRMTCEQVQAEVRYAWKDSYSPRATWRAISSLAHEPAPYKISHLIARLFFRNIYFPKKSVWGWLNLLAQNRSTILRVIIESFTNWCGTAAAGRGLESQRASSSSSLYTP